MVLDDDNEYVLLSVLDFRLKFKERIRDGKNSSERDNEIF